MFKAALKNMDNTPRKVTGCGSEMDDIEETFWIGFPRYLDWPKKHFLYSLVLLVIAIQITLVSESARAEVKSIEDARALINSGELQLGVSGLQALADRDDPAALIALFDLYFDQFYLPVDNAKAEAFLKRAVEMGDKTASWRWATLGSLNNGAINTEMLLELFEQGFEIAACDLSALEINLEEDAKDQICIEATRALALAGNEEAIGRLWQKDDPLGLELVEKTNSLSLRSIAARYGWTNSPNQADLDVMIDALEKNLTFAALHITFRYADTTLETIRLQNQLLSNLSSEQKDLIKRTLVDLGSGAKKGWFADDFENLYIATIFREGVEAIGLQPNFGVSYEHYSRCRGYQYPPGLCENWQGVLISNGGHGLLMDPAQGLNHFLEAHDLGDANASGNLAESYMLAEGVELDFERASEYLQIAIERGNLTANYELANLYADGLGVDQNLEKAADLYAIAATQAYNGLGDPMAMIKLAALHEQGRLPSSDLKSALTWYQKASGRNPQYETLTVGESGEVTYRALANAGVKRIQKRLEELSMFAGQESFGTYKALLVANERYENLNDLKTPEEDVLLIGSTLKSKFDAEVEYLINANRSALLSKLSQYRRELGPEDNFILYYAGHGFFDQELEVGYWQLSDAEADEDYSWVETDRVSRTLSAFKSINAIIIADSCYSGSVVRGNSALGDASNLAAIMSLNAKKSRVAITSGGLQPVLDATGSSEHSAFAKNFAAALEGVRGPTPASVLFTDLRTAVSSETAAWGFEQIPEFAPLYRAGHDGGDFVLSPVPD